MDEHVLQLAGLFQRGFAVAVIRSSTDAIQPLRDALAAAGAVVHPLPTRGRGPAGAARRLLALLRTLRAYPGCLLHLHLTGHGDGDLVALARQLAGAPSHPADDAPSASAKVGTGETSSIAAEGPAARPDHLCL